MRLPELLLVVPDGVGGGRLQVTSAQMRWNYGVDVIQPVRVVHQDGSVYMLDGAVDAIMAFYENDTDDEPTLQLEWVITGDNTATFSFLRAMASLLPYVERGYCVAVRFRDDDTEYEDVVALPGRALIDRRMGSFEEPVATIVTGTALARGPAGPNFTPTAVKTAAYQADYGELVVCDSSAGAFPVTLPEPDDNHEGERVGVVIAVQTPNAVTVVPDDDAEETINGAVEFPIELPWVIATFVLVGGNWIAW